MYYNRTTFAEISPKISDEWSIQKRKKDLRMKTFCFKSEHCNDGVRGCRLLLLAGPRANEPMQETVNVNVFEYNDDQYSSYEGGQSATNATQTREHAADN